MICLFVRHLLTDQAGEYSFEDLYLRAYKAVLRKKGEMLHDRVHGVLEEWLSEEVKPHITRLASACDEIGTPPDIGISISNETRLASQNFLVELKPIWERYAVKVSMVSDVFMFMVSITVSRDAVVAKA
jgi:hypothetical protein